MSSPLGVGQFGAKSVLIESRRDRMDGSLEHLGAIGVSQNIIDKSWQALADAYEYHSLQEEESQIMPTGEKALCPFNARFW